MSGEQLIGDAELGLSTNERPGGRPESTAVSRRPAGLLDRSVVPREASGPMTDIFDPRHYDGVRHPLLDAVSLPPWCYTSDTFYRREVDEILTKSWNLVGGPTRSRTRATSACSISAAGPRS